VNGSDVWVVIPAFNEEASIGQVIPPLLQRGYAIVVVDDGSCDRTWSNALRFPIAVLHHATNLGQGASLQTGIDYVLKQNNVRYVVTFDADGQHDPADIERLVEPLQTGNYDVVLGSRFLVHSRAIGIPLSRRLLLQAAALFTRVTTEVPVTDTHNGLRAFTAVAASRIQITQNGMAHPSEIIWQIASLKLRWCEVPVTIRYTKYSLRKGQRLTNSLNILWEIIRGRLR
jgi:polyprenyl-phospho-N-acetylgalactosaminyl synthase